MPLYEFDCKDCRQAFDELVRRPAEALPEVTCPSCGSHRVEKKVSAFAARSTSAAGFGGAADCAPGGT